MSKTFGLVFLEAFVVGICLVFLVYFINQINIVKQLETYIPIKSDVIVLFISGFLFHIIFEYTGINAWYSKNYCKLLSL
jgi:di/tricarboxylate transporter